MKGLPSLAARFSKLEFVTSEEIVWGSSGDRDRGTTVTFSQFGVSLSLTWLIFTTQIVLFKLQVHAVQPKFMHLSMLSPRIGGGGGGGGKTPGEIDIFIDPEAHSPPLGT